MEPLKNSEQPIAKRNAEYSIAKRNSDRRRSIPSNFGSIFHPQASGPPPLDESDEKLENPSMATFRQSHHIRTKSGPRETGFDLPDSATRQALPRVVAVTPRKSASSSQLRNIAYYSGDFKPISRKRTPSPQPRSQRSQSFQGAEGPMDAQRSGTARTPPGYGNAWYRSQHQFGIPGVSSRDPVDCLYSVTEAKQVPPQENEGAMYAEVRQNVSPEYKHRGVSEQGGGISISPQGTVHTITAKGKIRYNTPGGSEIPVPSYQSSIDQQVPNEIRSRSEFRSRANSGALRPLPQETYNRLREEEASSDSPAEAGFIDENVQARNVETTQHSPDPSPSTTTRIRKFMHKYSISKATGLLNPNKKGSHKKLSKFDSSSEGHSMGPQLDGDSCDCDGYESGKSTKSSRASSQWFRKPYAIDYALRGCSSLNVACEPASGPVLEEDVHSNPDLGGFYYPDICRRVPQDFFVRDQRRESSPQEPPTGAAKEEQALVRWNGSMKDTLASVDVIRSITRPFLDQDGINLALNEAISTVPENLAVAEITELVSAILRERYRAIPTYEDLSKPELLDRLRADCECLRTALRNFRIAVQPLSNPKKPVKVLDDFLKLLKGLWGMESSVLEWLQQSDIKSADFVEKIISLNPELLTTFCKNFTKNARIPAEMRIPPDNNNWNLYFYQIFKFRKNFIHTLEYLDTFEYHKKPFLCSMDTLLRAQMQRYTDLVVSLIVKCPIPSHNIQNMYYFTDIEIPKLSSLVLHMIRFEKHLVIVRPTSYYYVCVYQIRIDQIYSANITGNKFTLYTTKDVGVNSIIEILLHETDDSFLRHFFYDVLTTGTKPTFETEFRFTPRSISAILKPEMQKCVPFLNLSIFDELHSQCASIFNGSFRDMNTSLGEEINKLIENERQYVETLRAMQNTDLPPACNEHIQVKLKELYIYHSEKFYPRMRLTDVHQIVSLFSEFCSELIHYEEYIQLRTLSFHIQGEDTSQIYYVSPMRQLTTYITFLEQLVIHDRDACEARVILKEFAKAIQRTAFQIHSQIISGCKLDFFRLGFYRGEYGVAVDSKSDNMEKKTHTIVLYTKVIIITTHSVPIHNFYKALWFDQIHYYHVSKHGMAIHIRYRDEEKEYDYKFKAIDAPSSGMENMIQHIRKGIEAAPSTNSVHSSAHEGAQMP